MLPQTKSKIKNKPWEYHWLIYGQPKIGKSTFVSQFNDPLFLATEDRLGGLNVYKMPAEGAIKTWAEFCLICNEIKDAITKNNFKWNTIVIDTVDNLIQLCSNHVCRKNGISHQSDLEYGKGYAFVTNEFFRVINHLSNLGKSIVFIAHSEEKTVKTRTSEITKITPSVGAGKLGKNIIAMVDIVAYVGFDKEDIEKRVVYLRGNECLEAGDTTGKLDPIMSFNYSEINKKFSKIEKENKEIRKNKIGDQVTSLSVDNSSVPCPSLEEKTEEKKQNSLEEKKVESSEFDFTTSKMPENPTNESYIEAIKLCKNIDDLKVIWNSVSDNKDSLIKTGGYNFIMLAKEERKKELITKQFDKNISKEVSNLRNEVLSGVN